MRSSSNCDPTHTAEVLAQDTASNTFPDYLFLYYELCGFCVLLQSIPHFKDSNEAAALRICVVSMT